MATIATIQRELKKLVVLYQKQISEPEITLMAHLWSEELGEMSERDLVEALRLHRRNSNFWPTLAEVFKAHEACRPRLATRSLPAEAEITDEDLRRNQIYAGMMLLSLRGEPLAKSFFSRELAWPAKDALARAALGEKYPHSKDFSGSGSRQETFGCEARTDGGIDASFEQDADRYVAV